MYVIPLQNQEAYNREQECDAVDCATGPVRDHYRELL